MFFFRIYLADGPTIFLSTLNQKWLMVIPPPASHSCWKTGSCIIGSQYYEKHDFNQTHHIIGYQRNNYLLAHFKNSFGQDTWVLDKNFTIAKPGNFEVLAALGISYGYTDCSFKNSGAKAEFCPHYSIGVAYNKFRIEPVVSTGGDYISLAFRIKL
jgi:hypothetical protein